MKILSGYILCVACVLMSVFAISAAGSVLPSAGGDDAAVHYGATAGQLSPQGSIQPYELRAAQFADLAPQISMGSGVSLVRTVSFGGATASPAVVQVRRSGNISPVSVSPYLFTGILPSYGMSQSDYYIYALRRIRI